MKIQERMSKLLGSTSPTLPEEQEEANTDTEKAILTSLALAAASLGIDIGDDDAVDQFIADIKAAVTKEKSKLKSLLRRFTSTKAKTAAKQTIKIA